MISNFFHSTLFQTIVIFLTGLIAFFIYRMTKHNEKRDAARIILNEIRMAEKAIQEIKSKKSISEISIILPSYTWHDKKHLFLAKLDEDELNLISDFYNKCSYAEQYRKMIYDVKNTAIIVKSNYLQRKLIDMMREEKNDSEYQSKKTRLIEMANREDWLFAPNAPMFNMLDYIENIIFITPNVAGAKLKKIAK